MESVILTPENINYIRRLRIQDQWIDAPTNYGLSRYNLANRRNFVEDSDLQMIVDEIVNDRGELLDGVWYDKFNETRALDSTAAEATEKANITRTNALYDLIEARVKQIMVSDPAFRASMIIPGQAGIDTVKRLIEDIERLQTTVQFESGDYAFIPMHRL